MDIKLPEIIPVMTSEDNMSEDDKFIASLQEDETKYIKFKLSELALTKSEMKDALGISTQRLNKIEANPSIRSFILRKIREEYEDHLSSNARKAYEISEYATKEILKRFEEATVAPTSVADLLSQGYSEREARLILDSRVEGMKVKDLSNLVKDMNVVVKNAQEEEREEESIDSETINKMSSRFNKYRDRVLNINVGMFSSDQTDAFERIEGRDSTKVIDVELENENGDEDE